MTIRSPLPRRVARTRAPVRRILAFGLLALSFAGCATGAADFGPAPAPLPPPAPEALGVEEGIDYTVWRGDGTPASMADLLEAAGSADALLLGEEHDDVVGHRVQLEIFRRLLADYGGRGPMPSPQPNGAGPDLADIRPIVLSLEMFERDVQTVLDEYLTDLVTEDHFLSSARPWDNYERDYRPLVELAKATGVEVVAANAPRRYANRASRLGRGSLEELSEAAKTWLPPLPYPEASEAYRAEWDAIMGAAAMHMSGEPLDAQMLWDASMGGAIAEALDRLDDAIVVHLAGVFHVQNGTGTPETLAYYRPSARQLLVAVYKAETPSVFDPENEGAGDFVILTRAPAADR
jgi:uncharacterized iron-regulated protein